MGAGLRRIVLVRDKRDLCRAGRDAATCSLLQLCRSCFVQRHCGDRLYSCTVLHGQTTTGTEHLDLEWRRKRDKRGQRFQLYI